MNRIRKLVLLGAAAFFIASSIPAFATYPGKNGRIAFVNGPDIYTMNPDGSDVKQLTNLGPDNFASWESWSPDGKHIAFTQYQPPDYLGQLWIMNSDGSNLHLLLAESDFSDSRPSFTPDGSSVVFSRCYPDPDQGCGVYQVGLAGGPLTDITNIELGIQDNTPQYSVNGRLVFTGVGRGGIICAIYLRSRDGEGLRQLTPAPLSPRQPDWSPDGNRIAVSSHCSNPQNEEIWMLATDGNGLRQLTNNGTDYFAGPHDFHPSWSPQGDAIVFERDAPDFSSSAIYIMKQDGTSCRKLFTLHNSARSNYSRANQIKGRLRSTVTSRNPTQIEDGGALPQWGVASN